MTVDNDEDIAFSMHKDLGPPMECSLCIVVENVHLKGIYHNNYNYYFHKYTISSCMMMYIICKVYITAYRCVAEICMGTS